ncbi:hypothetical protein ONS95_005736 [Cadophora gregata]|uniref:uncharacterized protein n=1 Tax=Cadophora gregata TaxID=51156 RepID=UPI0026DC5F53|nr:uncharacterized protein ONS95_005736 [Cadophora gregata]KAK0103730.1 hypothetical protein ONS95_005736 [Cadophora gregata]KAK0107917.1 hypothetical protein ONS96_003704 [Cadophora gregata f. sp. sojae]
MKPSSILYHWAVISFATIPGVTAAKHKECSCDVWDGYNWVYDWELTFNTCVNNYSGEANYNHGLGRCKWYSGLRVEGDVWTQSCSAQASQGYYHVTNDALDYQRGKIIGKQGHGFCK